MCPLIRLLGLFFLVSGPILTRSYMIEDRVRGKLRNKDQPDTAKEQSGGFLSAMTGTLSTVLTDTLGTVLGTNDAGGLFLTPLIEKGQFQQAQLQAAVPPLVPGIESFSGFITVNKTCNSNMFFWLFKAMEGDWQTKPTILWLQGGPGVTSMFGLTRQIGPFFLDEKGQLQKRQYAWNQKYNVMFIDNPVGTGFSFTESGFCYASTQLDVAKDLYSFIQQFYAMFPELQKNKLYLAGESYAAKYQVSFAHHIYLKNKEAKGFVVPLDTLLIGNGLTDPKNMMRYGNYMYQLGMIDDLFLEKIRQDEYQIRRFITKGQYGQAERVWNEKIFQHIYNATGVKSLYNWRRDDVSLEGPEMEYIVKPEVRAAIHVSKRVFTPYSDIVYQKLVLDVMKSVKPMLQLLLNWEAYEIVAYNGQLDIICAYPLSRNVYTHLKWKLAKDYKKNQRCFYTIDDRIVGYYKNAGPFTEILFRDCGHMLTSDCPATAFDMLHRVVTNITSFKTKHACLFYI